MANQILFPAGAPSGVPVAQPIYLVDQFGNPLPGSGLPATLQMLNPAGVAESLHDNYDNQTAFASGAINIGTNLYGPFTNANALGLAVFFDITAISTGTALLSILGVDPVTGLTYTIVADAFAITTNNGLYTFVLHPGIAAIASTSATAPGAGAIRTAVNQFLPRTWKLQVVVATANITASLTYGYEL